MDPALQRFRAREQVHAGPRVVNSRAPAPGDVEPAAEVEPVHRFTGDAVLEIGVEIPERAVAHKEVVERRIELEMPDDRGAELRANPELLEVELVGQPRTEVKAAGLGLCRAGECKRESERGADPGYS